MNGAGRRLNIIHQSLVRPVLLAGAERPLAIANWITAAALILRRRAVVHRRTRRTAGDRRPLAAGAGRENRSGTEPGLHPPHSLSTGPLSGACVDLGAGATARFGRRCRSRARCGDEEEGEGKMF